MDQSSRKQKGATIRRFVAIAICLVGITGFFLPVTETVSLLGWQSSMSLISVIKVIFTDNAKYLDTTLLAWAFLTVAFGILALISCLIEKTDGAVCLILSVTTAVFLILLQNRTDAIFFDTVHMASGWYLLLVDFIILAVFRLYLLATCKSNFCIEKITDADCVAGWASKLSSLGLIFFLGPFAAMSFWGGDDFALGFVYLLLPFSGNSALFGGEKNSFFYLTAFAALAGTIGAAGIRKKEGGQAIISGICGLCAATALLFLKGISDKYLYFNTTGFGWYGACLTYFAMALCAFYASYLYIRRSA